MSEAALSVFEFVECCDSFATIELLASAYSKLLERFGFTHYIMAGLPSQGEDPESLVIVNRWPAEWLDRYRDQSYFFHDPVSLASFTQTRPFMWDEARQWSPDTVKARQIAGESREYGLFDGIGFPMADPRHFQAVVSLACDRKLDLPEGDRGAVYLASLYCQSHAQTLLQSTEPKFCELTPKEREVLTWIAHGKSKWDTSAILNVSENTVKKHVASAALKLDATNVTQAVVKAIRARQIKI